MSMLFVMEYLNYFNSKIRKQYSRTEIHLSIFK